MDKRLELLEYLFAQKRNVSNRELQTALGISKRTVINYVKDLNSLAPNIIHSSNQGYFCPTHLLSREPLLSFNRHNYLILIQNEGTICSKNYY